MNLLIVFFHVIIHVIFSQLIIIGCVVTHQGARGKDGEPGSAGPTVRMSVFCFILFLYKTLILFTVYVCKIRPQLCREFLVINIHLVLLISLIYIYMYIYLTEF